MAPAGRSYEEINSRFQIPDADQSLLSLIWNLKSGIWNYYGMARAGRSYEEINSRFQIPDADQSFLSLI